MATMHIEVLSRNAEWESVPVECHQFLSELCDLVECDDYAGANARLRGEPEIPAAVKIAIRRLVSTAFLESKEREWTGHGIWRTFRYWSRDEKRAYLVRANQVADALREVAIGVCYGFGSVLGFIRDHDFIPHDDDMDLIVALDVAQVSSFGDAKAMLKEHLANNGFKVYNDNRTHFTVNGADVFVGFREIAGEISWFPSARDSGLVYGDIFPASVVDVFDIPVAIPGNALKYLDATYGSDWRSPNSSWQHPWRIDEFDQYL